MRNHVEIEYTKRPDGLYNRWQKMSLLKLGIISEEDFTKANSPDYMNPYIWSITGVFEYIPRNKKVI